MDKGWLKFEVELVERVGLDVMYAVVLELARTVVVKLKLVVGMLVEEVDVVEFDICELVVGSRLEVALNTAEEEVVLAFSPN